MLHVPCVRSTGRRNPLKVLTRTGWKRMVREDSGQDLIEYALLAATIAMGTLLALQGVRDALGTNFNTISTTLGS
jgi:Flp pilus assembly pilin Flp